MGLGFGPPRMERPGGPTLPRQRDPDDGHRRPVDEDPCRADHPRRGSHLVLEPPVRGTGGLSVLFPFSAIFSIFFTTFQFLPIRGTTSMSLRALLLPLLTLVVITAIPVHEAVAQSKSGFLYDTTLYNKMEWREIGPFRGGRSVAVAGHAGQPKTFYFGATGGGIWKTEDGGESWLCVSDGFLKI